MTSAGTVTDAPIDAALFDAHAARAHLRRMRLVTEPVPKGPMRDVAFAVVRVYNADMLARALAIMESNAFGYRLVSRTECPAHPGWWRLYIGA